MGKYVTTRTKLPEVHKELVLEKLSEGLYLKDIGKLIGCTPQNISYALSKDEEFKKAKEEGIATRLDEATQLLTNVVESAGKEDSEHSIQDSLSLTRIYEASLKRLEWRASVECPERWGSQPKVALQINTVPTTSLLDDDISKLVSSLEKDSK